MGKQFDEVQGNRVVLKTKYGNWYVFVSEKDFMVTVPLENDPQHAEIRATVEALCRISSKGLKMGLTLSEVATQLLKADMGRNTVIKKISEVITDYIDTHKLLVIV